jgi:flavin-binding protein dodecin
MHDELDIVRDHDGKEHALNRARDDQSKLRVPMTIEDMGHVKHRRPSLRPGVEHFEVRLEVSVTPGVFKSNCPGL